MVDMVLYATAHQVKPRAWGVVLVSSMAGEGGNAWASTYSGSKALQTKFAEALWWELRPHGVDVLAPILSFTTTLDFDDKVRRDMLIEQTPQEVVSETMSALGRGLPTFTSGLVNKMLYALMPARPGRGRRDRRLHDVRLQAAGHAALVHRRERQGGKAMSSLGHDAAPLRTGRVQ